MNILIVSQYYWPENFRINELSRELVKLGNNVTVLTGLPNYPEGKIYKDFKKNKSNFKLYNGVNIIRVPIIPRKKGKFNLLINYISFTFSACFFGIIKILNKKFDLLFVFQTSPVTIGIPSTLISKIKKIPQVFWVLDIWPETLKSVGIKNPIVISLTKLLVNNIYKNCDLVLAQSRSFENNIKKYKSIKNNIDYFPAWSEFSLNVSNQKKAPEIKSKKDIFTLMYTGNIGEAQNFPAILKAIEILSSKKIKKFRLIIVGNGSKKEWLINEINKKKLEHLIETYDMYPFEKMPSIFAHADALLVSLSDQIAFNMTIPGKVQAYLATGIPILGMINGETAQVIKESKSGYSCNAGDYKQLSELIILLINEDKNKLKEMGLNGINYSEREFNKKNLILKLNNIFKKTLNEYS